MGVERSTVDEAHGARSAVLGDDRRTTSYCAPHYRASVGGSDRKHEILNVFVPVYAALDHLVLGEQAGLWRSYIEVVVTVLVEHVNVARVLDGA